jgi:hypothetical protein
LIEVPAPVLVALDSELTRDCEPRTGVPASGKLPIGDVLERLAAVEDALALCRNQLTLIRTAQP